MRTETYDVLILGGGNAGMGVTVATRAAGLSVAMVESRDLGGTCPNRVCTPKKGAGGGRARVARDRAGAPSFHFRRRAEARLGRAHRPREADDQPHPRLARPPDG